MMSKVRIFINGTTLNYMEDNIVPEMNVIQGIKKLLRQNNHFEFYILNFCSQENAHEKEEINLFLDNFIPQIPSEKRLFMPIGEDMEKYLPQGIQLKDVLIDNASSRLKNWQYKGGIGIQILNGRNNAEEWSGARIDCRLDALLFAYQLQYFIVSAVQDEYEFDGKW